MTGAGDLLLYAGSASAAFGCAAFLVAARRPSAAVLADRGALAAAAALVLALTLLTLDFLVGATDVAYVWAHTSTAYPWWYRLAGVWGGQDGTVVLWAALSAVASVATLRQAAPPRLRAAAGAALLAVVAALAWTAASQGTFAPTRADVLAAQPAGQGLVEVLVTPLMAIHPPVQFVAYALLAIPAAWAVAGLWTGDAAWREPAVRAARYAWAVATLGLGLGAIWAYYVLSFGGFWAWDPVEVANLLPWLALTGALHAARRDALASDRGVAAPLLASLAFALVAFATFSTRSGLWVSVHAFTDPADRFEPDAAARLVEILASHAPSAAFAAILAGTLAVVAVAFGRELLRRRPEARAWVAAHAAAVALVAGLTVASPAAGVGGLLDLGRAAIPDRHAWLFAWGLVSVLALGPAVAVYLAGPERPGPRGWGLVSTRPLLGAGVLVLGLAVAVTLVLDVAVVNAAERAAFDARAPLVAVPALALVALAFGERAVGPRAAVAAVAAALVAGVGLALAFRPVWALALAGPILAATATFVVARAVRVLASGASRAETWATGLLLVGGVLGVAQWSNPPERFLGVATSFGAGGVMMAVAALGVVAAVAAGRRRARPLAFVGCAAVALAFGYGVGALAGVAAGVCLARAPPARAGGVRPGLRQAGVFVAHLALVVGLLGFAGATYARSDGSYVLAPGEAAPLAGGEVRFLGVDGTPAGPDGRVGEVSAALDVLGQDAAAAFVWKGPPIEHYDPVLDVRRGWWRDVYVSPKAFHVEGVGVLREHTAPAFGDEAAFVPGSVRAVEVDVAVLPLMAGVWGGLWLFLLAMGLVLAGAREEGDPASGGGSQAPSPGRDGT